MFARPQFLAVSKALILALAFILLPYQAGAQEPVPLIKVIATGGTIANSPAGRMGADTVLAQIPEIGEHARIEVVEYSRINSSWITLKNWIDIASLIDRIFTTEPEVAGIVITHGSNTVEETAYFLSLTVNHTKPVVLTAAQRQQTTLGQEGTRNLFDAIRVAADPNAAGKGVMLVVNEKIHPARDVTKRVTVRVETWESGDVGALGLVAGDQVTFYSQPVRKHTTQSDVRLAADITEGSQLPRVEIVYVYADVDGALVEAAGEAGAQAIVVAGFPTGATTLAQYQALDRLREQGVVVIMSNRGGLGGINTNTNHDYISADNLTPQKARILAMLALARNPSADFVREVMATH